MVGLRYGHSSGHDMAERGHDTAGSVRARGLDCGLCRDTQYCIVTEARGWPLEGCVTIQSLYRDKRASLAAGVSRYNRLYRDRGAEAWPLGVSRYNAATRSSLCCDTTGQARNTARHACDTVSHKLRHGRCWACNTAHCAPRHGAVRAQPGRTVRAARVRWVCTSAPNPVLDSMHCFSHCLDQCS